MRNRAAAFLGLPALVLAAIVGCGADDEARPEAGVEVALPSYDPPDGAPGFCADLASTRELGALPTSMGALAAGPDVEARTQVSRAVRELRDVLSDIRDDGDHDDLAAALDGVVTALGQVIEGEATDQVRAAVTSGLEQVGATAQPVCGFPT
ncbi:hypothetical protein [Candidatus Blastococcus massiliensis]|uniref:hypothetical protein n=1 Tax=Candidatus Blastococcus massiliensis TaxID=1470358 RepID=UPI0004B68D0B|nr:hypothetical protein [Candidatus Blastococcus massiliensis]